MIEVTSIDARPGEAEIVTLMAGYMAARLFTPRQRRTLSVIIDLTGQPVRVPVTRAMLGPQKSGLGTRPPKQFEMTVSTAAGIRDAAEIVAHELLHISQAVNGRLLIKPAKRKINGVKRTVDTARWMGGKPVVIDELAWQYRPWEIEACHWQTSLVTEFLMLTTSQYAEQPVQAPKKKQLALYPVKVPAPVMMPRSQGPEFAPIPAMDAPAMDAPAMSAEAAPVATPASAEPAIAATATSVIASNDASIDAVVATAMPQAATPDAVSQGEETMPGDEIDAGVGADLGTDLVADLHVGQDDSDADLPAIAPIEEPDEALMADLAADLALGAQPGGSFGDPSREAAPSVPAASYPDHDGALRDMPVYDKQSGAEPAWGTHGIEVDVPGLDAPRTLDPAAMTRKLDELRDRGLAGA